MTNISRGWATTARTGLLTLIAGLLCCLFLATEAGAVLEDPDVDTFAAYEYRIDPEQGIVNVTIELAVTADKPNRTLSNGDYYEYYFPGYFVAIPQDAVGLDVTDGTGQQLNFSVDDDNDGFSIVDINFRRSIFYRQTANVVVTYSLPKGLARTEAPTRVNEAYAGFAIWLTPQIENASVTVISPEGFEDLSTGTDAFTETRGDGQIEFVAEDVDPEDFWALVSLARDEALTTTELSIEGNPIEVSAWPGDAEWAEHVTSNLEEGLPVLIDTVGLPWPIEDELSVIESYSPYLLGYAGWYDPTTDEIEIGDELDSHLVFHELSHVWFNDDLFPHRWITEGLSDVFGAAVVESLGQEPPDQPEASPQDPVAQPLNRWSRFDPDSELESWSYNASWIVTEAIRQQVGLPVLSEVIQAAAADQIAYLGDGAPEDSPRAADWRVYLDLIENRGEVTDDAVVDLFREWVLPPASGPTLANRSERRSEYRELATNGDGWAPPLGLRRAMSRWDFDDAATLIAAAEDIIDRRNMMSEVLGPLDASLPVQLEMAYESADTDLGDVASLMVEAETTADGLRRAHEDIEAVSGPLRWVGAIGTDYEADLERSINAFERGDLDTALDGSRVIEVAVGDLQRQGLIRVLIAVGVLVLLLAGIAVLMIRRRRKRRARPLDPEPPQPPQQPQSTQPEPLEAATDGLDVQLSGQPGGAVNR